MLESAVMHLPWISATCGNEAVLSRLVYHCPATNVARDHSASVSLVRSLSGFKHWHGNAVPQGQLKAAQWGYVEEGHDSPEKVQCTGAVPVGPGKERSFRKVLCLSNGHGEDVIATRVLEELQALAASQGVVLDIEALPLVGMGNSYIRSGFSTVGASKNMPSGGFIYMDVLQFIGDLRAGLFSLTLHQWRTVVDWVEKNSDGVLIAVGDVFPLALAWLVSKQKSHEMCKGFAFIGTAKSEFYVRGEDGEPLKPTVETVIFPGSIYLPWERHMMANAKCRLVVPRDSLTAEFLRQRLPVSAHGKVQSFGNPMMDGLHPTGILSSLCQDNSARRLALLPGSREPEVHANWRVLLEVVDAVVTKFAPGSVNFVAPIVPSLESQEFVKALADWGWLPGARNSESLSHACPVNRTDSIFPFTKGNTVLFLLRGGFSDCAHWSEAGIAMAGTATEQLVGLGRPVFTIPGKGPQFTYAFAEAQSRLLGRSIILCSYPTDLAAKLHRIMHAPSELKEVRENGIRRMGPSGAAKRIAQHLWTELILGR